MVSSTSTKSADPLKEGSDGGTKDGQVCGAPASVAFGLGISSAEYNFRIVVIVTSRNSQSQRRDYDSWLCERGGKRYTFVQASTGAMFALTEETNKETTGKTAGQTDRFARVKGKLIEVTANEFPPRGKANELPKLQVKRLRVIANKCPAIHRTASTGTPCLADQKPNVPATSPSTKPYVDPGTETQTPPPENNPNISGDSGAPSPGTGNPPCPPQ